MPQPPSRDFIVCFRSYVRADTASRIVHDALNGLDGPPAGSWQVVPRRNAAYRLPSDFALVRLQLRRPHRRRALRALRRHSAVRLLSPERRYGPEEPLSRRRPQSLAEDLAEDLAEEEGRAAKRGRMDGCDEAGGGSCASVPIACIARRRALECSRPRKREPPATSLALRARAAGATARVFARAGRAAAR